MYFSLNNLCFLIYAVKALYRFAAIEKGMVIFQGVIMILAFLHGVTTPSLLPLMVGYGSEDERLILPGPE